MTDFAWVPTPEAIEHANVTRFMRAHGAADIDALRALPNATRSSFALLFDSAGNVLADGDSVTLIKDLKVKGANQTLKQGTVIRSIRLTDDPEEIDCRHDTIKGLVLRVEFVRKR